MAIIISFSWKLFELDSTIISILHMKKQDFKRWWSLNLNPVQSDANTWVLSHRYCHLQPGLLSWLLIFSCQLYVFNSMITSISNSTSPKLVILAFSNLSSYILGFWAHTPESFLCILPVNKFLQWRWTVGWNHLTPSWVTVSVNVILGPYTFPICMLNKPYDYTPSCV